MGSDRLRLSSQLAKLGAWLTGRGKEDVDERKQRRVIMQSRGYVLTLSAQACLPFCFSDPFPDVNAHSPPHRAVCVCVSFLSPTSSPISLMHCGSCAGDGCVPMVQAGCGVPGGAHDSYWCSGVQLHSHRDPGATPTQSHTQTYTSTLNLHKSIHRRQKQSCTCTIMDKKCIFYYCCSGRVNNTNNRELMHTAVGLSGEQPELQSAMWEENNKLVTVQMYAV